MSENYMCEMCKQIRGYRKKAVKDSMVQKRDEQIAALVKAGDAMAAKLAPDCDCGGSGLCEISAWEAAKDGM